MPYNTYLDDEQYSSPSSGYSYSPQSRFGSLDSIVGEYGREYDNLRGGQAGLEKEFLERMRAPTDFGQFRGELSAMAEGLTNQFFMPGGAVEQATRGAMDQSVESGFGATSGGFDRSRRNIFTGARDQVAQGIAQGAMQIAPLAVQDRANTLNAYGQHVQNQNMRGDSMLENMFGGRATNEQLKLAQQQMAMNQRLVDHSINQSGGGSFWGKAAGVVGGIAGAALGPAGAAVGGRLGGEIGDRLFGKQKQGGYNSGFSQGQFKFDKDLFGGGAPKWPR